MGIMAILKKPTPERPPPAPAQWTLRGAAVPMPAVAIAAGWGWGTCAPTAIPVAARGDNSSVPRARAISRSSFYKLLEIERPSLGALTSACRVAGKKVLHQRLIHVEGGGGKVR